MRVWKCKQVVDFDNSTTTVKEERNKTLQHQTKDKYHFLVRLQYDKFLMFLLATFITGWVVGTLTGGRDTQTLPVVIEFIRIFFT